MPGIESKAIEPAKDELRGMSSLQKLARLTRSGELGRIVGFRLEFGWWVFDGTEVPCDFTRDKPDDPSATVRPSRVRARRSASRATGVIPPRTACWSSTVSDHSRHSTNTMHRPHT